MSIRNTDNADRTTKKISCCTQCTTTLITQEIHYTATSNRDFQLNTHQSVFPKTYSPCRHPMGTANELHLLPPTSPLLSHTLLLLGYVRPTCFLMNCSQNWHTVPSWEACPSAWHHHQTAVSCQTLPDVPAPNPAGLHASLLCKEITNSRGRSRVLHNGRIAAFLLCPT